MSNVKVGSMEACECDKSSLPYFVIAYKNKFPNIDITVDDNEVDWFDSKKRFAISFKNGSVLIYSYLIENGVFTLDKKIV